MIVVTGEFRFAEDSEDAVRAAMIDMMNETAKEAGCLHYRFYRDVERQEVYRVYEEWESDAHLADHAASAHMQVFRARLKEIGVVSRRVKKVEAGPGVEI
ncbi:MAG TPA: putative quinol monooxygenase [Paracoccaceae bacterium]|nr:putative quinol monooxygenase [Paracoccaceae bacterium]